MARLVGETVYTVVEGEETRDEWGQVYPGELEKTPFQAVVVPSGRSVEVEGMAFEAINSITLLFFERHDFEVGTDFEVRGEKFTLDQPTFDHVSPFQTSKGGTEIHLSREEIV